VYPADHFLKGEIPHVIATADSVVIDKSSSPWFDLARAILDANYQRDYLEITKIIIAS
jgi:hypothetical protein